MKKMYVAHVQPPLMQTMKMRDGVRIIFSDGKVRVGQQQQEREGKMSK